MAAPPKEKGTGSFSQGIQYTSSDWRTFPNEHNLEASMIRKGNCHDNVVAESFFSLLKKDRVKREIYPTRQQARSDIFDYIEGFYNPRRNHGTNGELSPVEYEKQYYQQLKDV